MNQIDDDLIVSNGVKYGNLWTGSDFRKIGINCPSLAVEFLQLKNIKKGILLWEHKDDETTKNLPQGKSVLGLYRFPK